MRNGYKYSNSLVQVEVADGRENREIETKLLSPGRVSRPAVLSSVLVDVASNPSLYMVLNFSSGAFKRSLISFVHIFRIEASDKDNCIFAV